MARQSSIDLDSPDRPFDNIINFRDVGRTINHFCGAECVSLPILVVAEASVEIEIS